MYFVGEAWGDNTNVLSLKTDPGQPVSGEGCNRAGKFTIQGDTFPEGSGAINLVAINKCGKWPLSLVWNPMTKMLNGTSEDKKYEVALSLVSNSEFDAACSKHAVRENRSLAYFQII